MTMDFLERLVIDTLDKQGYYATVVSPLLANGNSIAVMVMPANDYRHYYDGSKDQGFAFQVMTKHENQLEAYQTLLRITSLLVEIDDIPSANGSYEFSGITITTDPNVISKDDKYYIYGAHFSADLFIKGVVNDG
ncbi:phage tail terminator protein [Halalkalibacter oceani]|uniref:phage tail terminator protein n=1 Tax=Halalkalibacter oceani TaxID=1653776 RepID=UPI003393B11A